MTPAALSREAAAEAVDAAAWDARRPGLGEQFLQEVDALLPRLAARPRAFAALAEPRDVEVRRALLARFPYALLFVDLGKEIRVIAVAHLKREPGYWLERLR